MSYYYLLHKNIQHRSAKVYVIVWNGWDAGWKENERVFVYGYKRRGTARKTIEILNELEKKNNWPADKFVPWRKGMMIVPTEDAGEKDRYNLLVQTRCTHIISE